jgi:hypothetical protein
MVGESGGAFWGVTAAGEDGKARIFGEGWIGLGELAEEELRTLGGFNPLGMMTVGAETEPGVEFGR